MRAANIEADDSSVELSEFGGIHLDISSLGSGFGISFSDTNEKDPTRKISGRL
jgi:hypothetical protein